MSSDTEAFSIELPNSYVLQNYTITEVIGQGGFGITYLATENETERRVVIKENFPVDFSMRDRENHRVAPAGTKNKENFDWALGSFLNEAKILTRLNHPNIVRVLTAFKALGTAYYVMDYIGGLPLHKAAPAPQQMTEEWLLSILRPMLSALDYLHRQPEILLHRDIKPSNILVTAEGSPILIDFGAARSVICTRTHSKMGTPGYTPHEQWSSSKKCGPWTDIYALGATCYYLIIGEAPPDYNDRMPDETYIPLAPRPELQGHYTPTLLATIDKALALRPADRWQSAQEWLNELSAQHKRKLEEEQRQKAEEEERRQRELEAEKLKVKSAQAALSAAEEKIKQVEAARRDAEERAKQAEAARRDAEERAKQAEAARRDAEEKAKQAEAARRDAEEKAKQAEGAHRDTEEKAKQVEAARRDAEEKAKQAEAARRDAEEKAEHNNRKTSTGFFKYSAIFGGLLLASWLTVALTFGPRWAVEENYPTLLRSFLCVPKVSSNALTYVDKDGYTLLNIAKTEEIKRLLQEAAKRQLQQQNITPEKYNTALLEAAEKGNSELITFLITAGADVNTADKYGYTPLYRAAVGGHTECVKLLIAAGADVNKATNFGSTPLYWAARNGHPECVKLLISAGADVNKANNWGSTPLEAAKTEEIKQLLRDAGAK